jgi:small subunit ribosomal protein S4
VFHRHFLVTGRPVDRPSFSVKPGDVVTLRDRIHKVVRENMESLAGHIVPGWIEVSPAELTVKILALPTPDQIEFDVNTNLIVEFYR